MARNLLDEHSEVARGPGRRGRISLAGGRAGHIKLEWPHLDAIDDIAVLRAELARIRIHYNTHAHEAIGYVTPDDEHESRGTAIRQARRDGLERAREQRIEHHRNTKNRRRPHDAD